MLHFNFPISITSCYNILVLLARFIIPSCVYPSVWPISNDCLLLKVSYWKYSFGLWNCHLAFKVKRQNLYLGSLNDDIANKGRHLFFHPWCACQVIELIFFSLFIVQFHGTEWFELHALMASRWLHVLPFKQVLRVFLIDS